MEKTISHGTATGYQAHKCRCQPCREANTEAARKRRERQRTLNPRPTVEERFWQKVEKTDTCWIWNGSRNELGYGAVKIDSKRLSVHRVSYEMEIGPIPTDAHIDHLCFNASCVRPDHLRAVTRKQNMEHRQGANAGSKSGILGVTWNNYAGKWQGNVRHNGKQYYVGSFDDLVTAEAAVIAKRLELFTHNNVDRAA